ncbi:MAG: hypothetical protein BWY09_02715 [Candidatus Hydrogenedentes bacterium ADurb.Bin179]|nr:MAG: hypothetical protein BWY09_02715 [Candidatus Hydrogenedentes bacterium ADurb.Bin179]
MFIAVMRHGGTVHHGQLYRRICPEPSRNHVLRLAQGMAPVFTSIGREAVEATIPEEEAPGTVRSA